MSDVNVAIVPREYGFRLGPCLDVEAYLREAEEVTRHSAGVVRVSGFREKGAGLWTADFIPADGGEWPADMVDGIVGRCVTGLHPRRG